MFFQNNASRAMLRVLKARARIAQTQVFFASTIYGARLIETKEANKLRTNGMDIQFNADHITKHDAFVEGELLHEVLHCALNHPARRSGRDPEMWNEACDYSINPLISQYFQLPKTALVNSRFQGKSPERIYEILKMEKQEQEGNQGQGQGQPQPQSGSGKDKNKGSEPMYDGDSDEAEAQMEAQQKWSRTTHLAADKATKASEMHGTLKELIDQMYSADKLDWRMLIRDMARDAKEDNARSWARPNRRLWALGIHMPGKGDDKICRLILCIDSSGSISKDALREMKAEAMGLLEQSLVNEVIMISTDTRVCSVARVTTPEEAGKFDLGSHGGGTNFVDAMNEVAKYKEAMGCVFFTDMETNSFGKEPNIPVVWVNWGSPGHKAPYGKTTLFNK